MSLHKQADLKEKNLIGVSRVVALTLTLSLKKGEKYKSFFLLFCESECVKFEKTAAAEAHLKDVPYCTPPWSVYGDTAASSKIPHHSGPLGCRSQGVLYF